MNPDFSLIQPPIQLKTRDPLITVASDKDEATIVLSGLQPRLYKRLTKKRKTQQLVELTESMQTIFNATMDQDSSWSMDNRDGESSGIQSLGNNSL